MSVRDLMPWSRGNGAAAPSTYRDYEQSPFLALHREMNRLFDDMWRDFNAPLSTGRSPMLSQGWPHVEISETDNEIRVSAELPGMEEKDVELLFNDGVLTIKGEKQAETEDKDRQFSERYYGRFERRIPLGTEVDEDKVSATFRNGVLTVSLPKTAKAQAGARRIAINGGTAGTTTH
ncbi:MAG TPA: Hsp20/alpha crystallin family protein [Devosia sp.]|nr:Hsp20/alpha crystallin family protein [Devosia sp.]